MGLELPSSELSLTKNLKQRFIQQQTLENEQKAEVVTSWFDWGSAACVVWHLLQYAPTGGHQCEQGQKCIGSLSTPLASVFIMRK